MRMMKRLHRQVLLSGAVAAVWVFGWVSLPLAQYQWTSRASMPTPRYDASAVTLGNRLYVLGGYAGEDSMAPVERYDPIRDTWDTTVADLKVPRANAAAVVWKGNIYIFGGEDREGHFLKSVECYDPQENRWKRLRDMLVPRSAPAAVVYHDVILILGGSDARGNYRNDVEVYDMNRDIFSPGAQFLLPINRTSSEAAVYNDNLYLFGGLYYGPIATIDRFTPSSGWKTVASLAHPRGNFALVQFDNRFYIIGGQGYSGIESTIEVWVADSSGNLKEKQEIFWPNPLKGAAAAGYNGEIFLFGGEDPRREEITATVQSLSLLPTTATAVHPKIPAQPELVQAFPNPSHGQTTFWIRFPAGETLGRTAKITLFNLRGELVWQKTKRLSPGQTAFVWNGLDRFRRTSPAGIYVYRVELNGRILSGKLLLIR